MSVLILQANANKIPLPDKSVQTIVTSPPYYKHRNYGVDEQIGAENRLEDYVNNIMLVVDECWRVLKDNGIFWLNIDDTYNGGGRGGNSPHRSKDWNPDYQKSSVEAGMKAGDLMLVPFEVAKAIRDRGWYMRDDCIWHKPNARPGPAEQWKRPIRDHEYLFMFTKQMGDVYYNADAVRVPYDKPMNRWGGDNLDAKGQSSWDKGTGQSTYRNRDMRPNKDGRHLRTTLSINTSPYAGPHFATFPPELPETCIKAGSKPCDIVLDPFGGSGTTAMVAHALGRTGIITELNFDYCQLARERTGLRALDEWLSGKKAEANLEGLPMFENMEA